MAHLMSVCTPLDTLKIHAIWLSLRQFRNHDPEKNEEDPIYIKLMVCQGDYMSNTVSYTALFLPLPPPFFLTDTRKWIKKTDNWSYSFTLYLAEGHWLVLFSSDFRGKRVWKGSTYDLSDWQRRAHWGACMASKRFVFSAFFVRACGVVRATVCLVTLVSEAHVFLFFLEFS